MQKYDKIEWKQTTRENQVIDISRVVYQKKFLYTSEPEIRKVAATAIIA